MTQDDTNLVDVNIGIMNTQEPLLATYVAIQTNSNQPPPLLVPYPLTINDMTVKELRNELGKMGLKIYGIML